MSTDRAEPREPSWALPATISPLTGAPWGPAPSWSLPFGILWSITIKLPVFAKQNPLDLMISENESNGGGNSQGGQGFEVLDIWGSRIPLVLPLPPADTSWTACPALPQQTTNPKNRHRGLGLGALPGQQLPERWLAPNCQPWSASPMLRPSTYLTLKRLKNTPDSCFPKAPPSSTQALTHGTATAAFHPARPQDARAAISARLMPWLSGARFPLFLIP